MAANDALPPDRLLTAYEAAHRFSVSLAAIRRWTYTRQIPFVRLLNGRAVRYSERALEALIKRWTVRPLVPPRPDDEDDEE
jgi:excisionase family DNA binding protein